MQVIEESTYLVPLSSLKNAGVYNINTFEGVFTPVTYLKDRGMLSVPKGNKEKFKSSLGNSLVPIKIGYVTPKVTVKVKNGFNLRHYQELPVRETVEKLNSNHTALLKAPAGFGKSFCLPFILKEFNTRTLIVVDRTLLRDQMLEEIRANTDGMTVNILDSSTKELSDINIVMAQYLTVSKTVHGMLRDKIGFVVIDECHLISVGSMTKAVLNTNAKYLLGLSATPTRSDGLTEILTDYFGDPVIGTNPDAIKINYYGIPVSGFGELKLMSDKLKMWRMAYEETKLRKKVVQFAIKSNSNDNKTVVYTTSIKMQQYYKEVLEQNGVKSEIINSMGASKKRQKILDDFKNGDLGVLIVGRPLEKGVSIPDLNVIVLASPTTKEAFEQLVGRLRRGDPSKKAVMIDVFPKELSYYKLEFKKRILVNNKDTIQFVKESK